MYRNVDDIGGFDCLQLIDDKTLIGYAGDPTSATTIKLINNNYLPVSIVQNTPVPADVQCYTQEQIGTIPSPYDFMTPVFHLMAIASVLFLVYGAYRLILYPFFRSRV